MWQGIGLEMGATTIVDMKKILFAALALAIAATLVQIVRKNGTFGATERATTVSEGSQPEIAKLEGGSTAPADAGLPDVVVVTNKVVKPRTVDIVIDPQFGGAK